MARSATVCSPAPSRRPPPSARPRATGAVGAWRSPRSGRRWSRGARRSPRAEGRRHGRSGGERVRRTPGEDAMDVGVQMVFASYGWSNVSDEQVWDEEVRLGRLAADLGFDVLWSVEHHFNDYSFCPDNLQLMSYLAAVCPHVGLPTAAVIWPCHDPLRVAEQVPVLDHR